MIQILSQRSAPLFSATVVNHANRAPTLVTADRRSQTHWHLIGDYFRPLHEQLGALSDAGNWATVVAEGSTPVPLAAAALSPRSADLTLASVQHGLEYAAIAVAGEIDGPAIQQMRHHVRALLDTGVEYLVVSLADVLACDARLGALLSRVQLRLRARNGQLELIGIPTAIRPLMQVGMLSEAFATCDPVPHTVDSASAWATPSHGLTGR